MSIKEIVSGVNVDNEEKNYEATQSARKMLSRERNPPIDDVINVSIGAAGFRFMFWVFTVKKHDLMIHLVWDLASPGSIPIT